MSSVLVLGISTDGQELIGREPERCVIRTKTIDFTLKRMSFTLKRMDL